jgi:manganese/zinc/iron transport system substrate-binding protein
MLSRRVSVLVLGLVTVACSGGSRQEDLAGGGSLKALATTSIVADLVRNIAPAHVDVEALMGPGIDPHLYTPSAGDVRRLAAAADAIFFNGLHLEGKMAEVLEEMGRRGVPAVAVAECVDPQQRLTADGAAAAADPHVWFDVSLWQIAARCTADGLLELDPGAAAEIEARYTEYHQLLEDLDGEVHERLAQLPEDKRILITAHDAFAYFGKAYGIEVRGLLGISTASEAGTADVQQLAEFIVSRRIPAVFVETSVSPRYVEALQEAVANRGSVVVIGGSLYSDALGDSGTTAETYIGTMRANVDTIVTALAGS